jgi:hypothetical protein
MADHRKTAPGKSSAKVPAWAVLITMGGTSITLNFWDATHAASPMFWLIAGLRGFAPVLAAMFISEAGARFDGGKVFRRVTFAIMGGAMLLSASAVANVLRPSYPAGWLGLGMAWLFGIVLDAAALTGLWIILTERERRRAAERAEEARDAAGEMAEAVAAAEARVAEQAHAEADEMRAAMEAELARLSTELTAANATAEALREKATSARKRRRTSARKPATTSARNQPAGTAPEPAPGSAGSSAPEDVLDVDAEATLLALIEEGKSPTDARILALIAGGHSASEAGVLAGKSDSYGRYVARLAKAAKKEPAGGERTDGDVT